MTDGVGNDGVGSPLGPVAANAQRPSPVRSWLLAARPKTLTAAAAPVLVGSACAASVGRFHAASALAALLGALLLQVGANFANDLFDFEKGADTAERVGPTRAVQAGWITPVAMRRALLLVFGLALAVGAYLVSVAGSVLVAIGLGSIVAALAYTGGPYPLGYHGLGDVCVLLFFGFVAVAGTAYVQAGYVPSLAWGAALPIGCLSTAILVVNNVRDVETDVLAGKRTLPVRWGRGFGIAEYAVLLLVAYAVPLVWVLWGTQGGWVLLPLLTAPLGLALVRRVRVSVGRELNPCLAQTARLLFLFAVLLTLGITLEARV